MAFLDNSGDIILDAVLTDTGRARLGKGDGTFKIVKFALADDEIDYGLYDDQHPSGSAYYDLEVLQTPVLEAFTNNASSMKHKLVSIPRTTLLYMPVVLLNTSFDGSTQTVSHASLAAASGMFLIASDDKTEEALGKIDSKRAGILLGESLEGGGYIRADQGLDTTDITPSLPIDADLNETQYIVEIDNRFGLIASKATGNPAAVSYIDDDNIASYYFSQGTDGGDGNGYVEENTNQKEGEASQVIKGPRGTYIQFKVQASLELNTSTYLFTQLGGQTTWDITAGGVPYQFYYLDSTIRVSGATTGSSLDIPVRFIKLKQ